MKIFSSLFVARPIPKEPVPFKELLPLKLKGAVSGKGGKSSDVVCSKEIESFKKCYKNHLEAKKLKEEKEAKGVLTPGEKKMSHKQLNALLRKFPNIK
ncbi:uncharacterized protein LOC130897125 [Diorhabda carinulata]|uniref:uncharacterized protein LOC130897125 n=1 Tax=Diorhabda carinulata TaxID=1163345 RepID=UPI0025A23629|nr:uncharacterized protein LOC130897125 [Diorhabda carinulata]